MVGGWKLRIYFKCRLIATNKSIKSMLVFSPSVWDDAKFQDGFLGFNEVGVYIGSKNPSFFLAVMWRMRQKRAIDYDQDRFEILKETDCCYQRINRCLNVLVNKIMIMFFRCRILTFFKGKEGLVNI